MSRQQVYASSAERQKAYRQRKRVTNDREIAKRNVETNRLEIVRALLNAGIELKHSYIVGDIWFAHTQDEPYGGLKPWIEEEAERLKWIACMKRHIQAALEPLGVDFYVFSACGPHEKHLTISVTLPRSGS